MIQETTQHSPALYVVGDENTVEGELTRIDAHKAVGNLVSHTSIGQQGFARNDLATFEINLLQRTEDAEVARSFAIEVVDDTLQISSQTLEVGTIALHIEIEGLLCERHITLTNRRTSVRRLLHVAVEEYALSFAVEASEEVQLSHRTIVEEELRNCQIGLDIRGAKPLGEAEAS